MRLAQSSLVSFFSSLARKVAVIKKDYNRCLVILIFLGFRERVWARGQLFFCRALQGRHAQKAQYFLGLLPCAQVSHCLFQEVIQWECQERTIAHAALR